MSTIIADNLTGKTSAGSVTVTSEGGAATQSLQQGLAKAFASIDQDSTGHPTYDSLNIASTTDSSTGETTVAFTNNMNNANYILTGGSQCENESATYFGTIGKDSSFPMTTSDFRTDARNSAGTSQDSKYLAMAVHGDLA